MKTRNEYKADIEENANNASLRWRLIALLLPIVIVASMIMSLSFIRKKIVTNNHVSNSFRAGDIAMFVAMPLLNAALR